jgi:hypothetical protein
VEASGPSRVPSLLALTRGIRGAWLCGYGEVEIASTIANGTGHDLGSSALVAEHDASRCGESCIRLFQHCGLAVEGKERPGPHKPAGADLTAEGRVWASMGLVAALAPPVQCYREKG